MLDVSETDTIAFTFNTDSLSAGIYEFGIHWTSNDPLLREFVLPVKLMVIDRPQAGFSPDKSYVCDDPVTFSNATINGAIAYFWDFGDGGVSTEAEPTHVYQQNGVYDVQLIACNVLGCDTLVRENLITVSINGMFCDTLLMPAAFGQTIVGNACTGVLYDSEGRECERADPSLSPSLPLTLPIHRGDSVGFQVSIGLRKMLTAGKAAAGQRRRVGGFEYQVAGGIYEFFFLFGKISPKHKHQVLALLRELFYYCVGKKLPADSFVRTGLVFFNSEHGVEQEDAVLGPGAQVAVVGNRNAQVGVEFFVNVLQGGGNAHTFGRRKRQAHGFAGIVVGVLPQDDNFDFVEGRAVKGVKNERPRRVNYLIGLFLLMQKS